MRLPTLGFSFMPWNIRFWRDVSHHGMSHYWDFYIALCILYGRPLIGVSFWQDSGDGETSFQVELLFFGVFEVSRVNENEKFLYSLRLNLPDWREWWAKREGPGSQDSEDVF